MTEEERDKQVEQLFLRHFGVKGMKWGVRKQRPHAPSTDVQVRTVVSKNKKSKSKIKTAGGENHPPTADAIKAALSKQKLKKSGSVALTNAELRDLADRMNLEQNVHRLISSEPKGLSQQFVTNLAKDPHKTVRTAKEISDIGKNVVETATKLRR